MEKIMSKSERNKKTALNILSLSEVIEECPICGIVSKKITEQENAISTAIKYYQALIKTEPDIIMCFDTPELIHESIQEVFASTPEYCKCELLSKVNKT